VIVPLLLMRTRYHGLMVLEADVDADVEAGGETDVDADVAARAVFDDSDDLDKLMGEMMNRLRTLFHARVQRLDLTMPQAITLKLIDEAQPMGDLARALSCDASNMTGIADRLEERGLVTRQAVPGDRRVKALALTPAGRALRSQMDASVSSELVGLGNLAPAERRQFAELLRRILAG
jgi:DNA-binding MarR family transcriptional regulator